MYTDMYVTTVSDGMYHQSDPYTWWQSGRLLL